MPTFTILLPHKINPGNDAALSICIDCLAKNTDHDFGLLMSAASDQPLYATMNRLVQGSPTDLCVFMHSDMFVAPHWDTAMLDTFDENVFKKGQYTFVTGLLVEPGAIGVWSGNVTKDFGRKPETFRRAEFEAWTQSAEAPQASGEGWYAPYALSREAWLANGGHDLADPEGVVWTALDVKMFGKWKKRGGHVIQARSIIYHLQRYSDPDEQEAEKRQ